MRGQLKEQGNKTRSKIYEFIVDFITNNGYSPSIREIAEGTGIKSISSIKRHLFILEQSGMIRTKEFKPRTISLPGYRFVKDG